ncbi:MAG: cytochrome c biogenesis protein CcsA, partial [Candidatus Methylomirabilales bacterium]
MRLDRRLKRLTALVAAAMLAGLAAIFFWVPTEEFSGVVQRVFYIHVPAAWAAYLAFVVVAVGSVAYLRSGSTGWDTLAHASAEVGVLFTIVNVVTGMAWGKPIWGTYWSWDPRLTSMFVLLLIYAGYLIFRALATDPTRGARLAAVIGIVGLADIPLVHFSVFWARGLHPAGTVIGGPRLPNEMLATLIFMGAVFLLLYTLLLA